MVIRPITWSYTRLQQYRNCPKQYQEMVVLKNFVDADNEHNIWGNRVHTAFEEALRDQVLLPVGMELWQSLVEQFRGLKGRMYVEQNLALTEGFVPCRWMAPDVWVRGKIDALWIDGNVAKAVDWKTGKRKPNSEQLALFALLTFHHYPQVQTVRTMFVWLKTLETDMQTYTREQIPELWQLFMPDLARISHSFQHESWPARSSGLCRNHCPVVTCSYNGNAHLARGT